MINRTSEQAALQADVPTTHVLHRFLRESYPAAAKAEGCEITDTAGVRYIDGSSGAAVSCVGHRHPAVLDAMRRQIDSLDYAHTSFFTTAVAEELADHLAARAPRGFELSQFVSSGSEAVEAALKFTRQFHVENGQPQRQIFIARRQSYHGSTLGALSVTERRASRLTYAPLLMNVPRVSPCYEYRGRNPRESVDDYAGRLAAEFESVVLEVGPERVAGFIAEPVVGATLGAVPAVPGYFKRLHSICQRHGIVLILDEVMCGMGRTGALFTCEQEGVTPDLITIAKGLGGGYAPIGALLVRSQMIEPLRRGSGAFQHGQTYMGHPLSCAAALAVQKLIERDGLLANVLKQGARLEKGLRERLGDHPFVGDIRGRGLLLGVELVADRSSKAPFPAALKMNAQVRREAMQRGLLVLPMGGTADGVDGDHLLIAPPFVIDEATVDALVERLGEAIDAATRRGG